MARIIDGRFLPTFLDSSPTKETNPTWEMIMKDKIIQRDKKNIALQ